MSLINQALKLEQQKRHIPNGPVAPMMHNMANRGRHDKLPLLLIGFTGMGVLLALSISAIFYFGSDYLRGNKQLAASIPLQSENVDPLAAVPSEMGSEMASTEADSLANALGTLSAEQLSTVQKMLLERRQLEDNHTSEASTAPLMPANQMHLESDLSEISRIQETVDSYTVQGIRKAGQGTRVFLNGKIQRIGDVIDIEMGLVLVGFTDTYLIFSSASGQTFKKSL